MKKLKSPLRSMLRPLLGAAAFAILGAPQSAQALDVVGNLTMNTTWHKSDSPVRLLGDVTVLSHVTLTIEAGTVIEAATSDRLGAGSDTARVELIVKGKLKATGNSSSPVILRGATSTAETWYGVVFDSAVSGSALTYTNISDTRIGLYALNQQVPALSDLTIARSPVGIWWKSLAGPTITRARIIGSTQEGIHLEDNGSSGARARLTSVEVASTAGTGLKIMDRVSAEVNRSGFFTSNVGIDAVAGSALTLTNSVVAANRTAGMVLRQASGKAFRIINNTIDLNTAETGDPTTAGVGIDVEQVSDLSKFLIRNNSVTNHGTYGIQVVGGVFPALDHNNVWNNFTNYSAGVSAGPGAMSTNPLYAGGFLNSFAHLNYPNGDSYEYSCIMPSATGVYVSFSVFETESGYDPVSLVSASGEVIQTISGNRGAFVSSVVPGDRVIIRFRSDGSTTGRGFAGTCVALGPNNGASYRLPDSSPVIDVGNGTDAPRDDFDGASRPFDGDYDGTAIVDIGAFEYHQNGAPTANAGPDRSGPSNVAMQFDGRGSSDPDGRIVQWAWDFGDGTGIVYGPLVTHAFTALGTYTVRLTVTDDGGLSASDTASVSIVDNVPPIADAGYDQRVPSGGLVSLDGGFSTDPDGVIVSYVWNFNDGSSNGTGRALTHVFPADGVYTVVLTVTDNKGATASDSVIITVGRSLTEASLGVEDPAAAAEASANAADGQITPQYGCNYSQSRSEGAFAGLALLAGLLLYLARRRFLSEGV